MARVDRIVSSDIDVDDSFVTLGHKTPIEDRMALLQLAQDLPPYPVIIEVGCFVGMTTTALVKGTSESHIHCVDHFCGNPDDKLHSRDQETVFRTFCGNMLPWLYRNVHPHCCTSWLMAEIWPYPVDMVYLDAGHTAEDVEADYIQWKQHVKPGGILCGHDYSTEYPEVVETVNRLGIDGHSARVWWKRV